MPSMVPWRSRTSGSSTAVGKPEESVEIVNRRDLLRRRTRIGTSGPELAAAVVDELIAQVAGGR